MTDSKRSKKRETTKWIRRQIAVAESEGHKGLSASWKKMLAIFSRQHAEIEGLRERIDKLKELNKVIGDHANNLVETVLKQDERIAELEEELSKVGLLPGDAKALEDHFRSKLDEGHHITDAQLASGEVVLLTQGQIDAAWTQAIESAKKDYANEGALVALEELGIERCLKHNEGMGGCPRCHGKGWIKT